LKFQAEKGNAAMLKLVSPKGVDRKDFELSLDEIAREGARRMLVQALNLEVEDYIAQNKNEIDKNGNRLVVKNGRANPRHITTGSGTIEVAAPRVDDRREGKKFSSFILPPYLRKSPKVESLLPILYLKGLSTNDFKSALAEFLGEGVSGLSPASIVKLKKIWEDEFAVWSKRKITKNYIYIWADGVNVEIRLGEDDRLCLLVIIGVTEEGKKELIAVESGYRESTESWSHVLRSLTARGMTAPLLACGDGALGFWSALRSCEGFQATREQRCWVHKIANVLDKLPKRLQPKAKELLHEMMRAEKKSDAEKDRDQFAKLYQEKYPKAVECLLKHWTQLTTYFDFPASHWIHLRTTNPIESSFATVKLRTRVTKGAGSKKAAEVMAFKLLLECEKKWRIINGVKEIKNLIEGLAYKDGIMIPNKNHQEAAAG
jgi:putative transposase